MAALPKMGHQMSGLHVFGATTSEKSRNGGNPVGYGPIAALAAGNWQCAMSCDGPGSIVLQNAATGAVLATAPHHRFTLASATNVQFVVTSSNLAAIRGCGGTINEDLDFANFHGQGTAT